MKKQNLEEIISYRLFFMGLVSLCLTALFCIFVFHRAFQQQVRQDLSMQASEVAAAYDYFTSPNELRIFSDVSVRITLIDPEGSVLYESAASPQVMENHLNRPEIREALESGSGTDQRDSETLGLRTYYYALLLPDGNILRLAQDAAGIWAIYDNAIPAVIISCVLIMALAVLLSWFLTRSIVRPVLKLSENLEGIQDDVPYKELVPFADAIHSDRVLRENNERIRQEFTANVSHELKTPLTSISGYAELVENGMARSEDIPGFAKKIHDEAARMIVLVNDIIRLTQLDELSESLNSAPVMEPCDLLDVAKKCVEQQSISAKRAFITLSYEGESAFVSGDRAMLDELCMNLCDNAIRYNRPGGKVTITAAHSKDGRPILSVRDTGIGIPKEAQRRVFERFYRVDKSHSKATGGTGLGLAIVKHIAKIHNAHLTLESTVGTGTEITLTF